MARIVDSSQVILMLGLSASITEEERAMIQSVITMAEGSVRRHLQYDPVMALRTEYYPQADFTLTGRQAVWEVDTNDAFLRRLSEVAVDELQVRHLPVRELDEDGNNAIDLRIDFDARSGTKSGSFAAATQKTEGEDFYPNYDLQDSNSRKVCRDGIIRSQGRWPSVAGSVRITYVGGYTDAELNGQDANIDASPIMEAVLDESIRRMQKAISRQKKTSVGFVGGPFSSETLGDYSYSLDTAILTTLIGSTWDIMPETAIKLQDFVNYGFAMAS